MEPNEQVHTISESEKPLELIVKVTVPIICKVGDSCRVLVHLKTDNTYGLLDVCLLEFKPGPANQSQTFKVAAKRDFILDGTNFMRITFLISKKEALVDWNSHYPISDAMVCTYTNECFLQAFFSILHL